MNKTQIESYGYDKFIGRAILENDEHLVCLPLNGGAEHGFMSMEQALEDLCNAVKKGEKVLLTKSPGKKGPQRRSSSQIRNILNEALAEVSGGAAAQIIDNRKDEEYTLAGRRYEPFKPEQMDKLRSMYESKEDMKKYPNPFENQPLLN